MENLSCKERLGSWAGVGIAWDENLRVTPTAYRKSLRKWTQDQWCLVEEWETVNWCSSWLKGECGVVMFITSFLNHWKWLHKSYRVSVFRHFLDWAGQSLEKPCLNSTVLGRRLDIASCLNISRCCISSWAFIFLVNSLCWHIAQSAKFMKI